MHRLVLSCFLGLTAPLWIACKASLQGDSRASMGGQDEPESALASRRTTEEMSAQAPLTASAAAAQETSFIGVTHVLSLSADAAAKPVCSCLAAAIGPTSDAAFVWQGQLPIVGPEAIVLAIDAAPCPAKKSTAPGPSIRGIESEGDNLVVHLEQPRPGAPWARGAVAQRPRGAVIFRGTATASYVKPLTAGAPDGKGECQMAVPAAKAP